LTELTVVIIIIITAFRVDYVFFIRIDFIQCSKRNFIKLSELQQTWTVKTVY